MNPGPQPKPKRRQVNLTLDDALADRLQAAAAERGLSQSYLASSLIAEALDRLLPVDQVRWTS